MPDCIIIIKIKYVVRVLEKVLYFVHCSDFVLLAVMNKRIKKLQPQKLRKFVVELSSFIIELILTIVFSISKQWLLQSSATCHPELQRVIYLINNYIYHCFKTLSISDYKSLK